MSSASSTYALAAFFDRLLFTYTKEGNKKLIIQLQFTEMTFPDGKGGLKLPAHPSFVLPHTMAHMLGNIIPIT